ncbi:MAG: hypothetical protein IPG89_05840 [Bacteroidetes bacterium]|nr:hypothetical protein [Bacteroidota bacterium]
MKHVKKKFIVRKQITASALEVIESHTPNEEDNLFVKELIESNKFNAFIQTTDGELFQAFKYKFENNTYLVPEMDASVLYFEMGRTFLKRTKDSKKKFLASIKQTPNLPLQSANCFFEVFAHASICIPFLHNSVECFINNYIPIDYEFVEINKREKKETWNKMAIQFDWTYEDKIKLIMPDISKQKYHEMFQTNYSYLTSLKT